MNKSPAFQFYAADFLIGVMGMSDDEIGIYIKMLASQWEHGSLPSCAKSIKKLISSRKLPSENVLSKFPICDDGFRRNTRLEKEREKQSNFRESRSKSANKRWNKDDGSNARASEVHGPSHIQKQCSLSSSSSSSSERESKSAHAQPTLPDEWEDFADSMPTEAAKDFDGLSKRINSLHPSWARRPHFTAQELRELQSNSRIFFDLTDADWSLLAAYMAAAVPSDWGIKLWQPDIRGRFLTSVTDVLSHADNWKRECKKRGVTTGLEGGAK